MAYAQDSAIHLGPVQEKHLLHEAWHLVQQRQGKVRPTTRMNGVAVNDAGLEREADLMGAKVAAGAAQRMRDPRTPAEGAMRRGVVSQQCAAVVQRNRHPLEDDEPVLNVEAKNALKKLDPDATLRNLILEDTDAAAAVMAGYPQKRGFHAGCRRRRSHCI